MVGTRTTNGGPSDRPQISLAVATTSAQIGHTGRLDSGPVNPVMVALRPLVDPRAYLALLFVLMRFPMAIVQLVLYVTLVGIGLSTLLTGIGLVFLLLFAGLAWLNAIFDRELGRWWFGYELRPMWVSGSPADGIVQRFRNFLTNRVTWKSVGLYHVDMLSGLVLPWLLLAGVALAVALVLAPLVAWVDIASFRPGDPNAPLGVVAAIQWLGYALPAGAVQIGALLVGVALGAATLHAAQALVRVHAVITTNLSGHSLTQVELDAARVEAASQQARAERSEQSRRELIVNASHELRTPIASIRGHVEALLDPANAKRSRADQRRYLEIVQRETERLSSLVDDLLAVARADAGELHLDVRPTDVRLVAEQVAGALAPIAERDRQVKLVTDFGAGVPPALADSDRLSQVLMNLVRNAITYTPEGGLVALAVSPNGPQHVEVTVEDTGIGIPADELERIFDRFYRTDASRSRATGGFGLGLSISRDLIQAMGGSIEVKSEPGTGSRFTVKLRRA